MQSSEVSCPLFPTGILSVLTGNICGTWCAASQSHSAGHQWMAGTVVETWHNILAHPRHWGTNTGWEHATGNKVLQHLYESRHMTTLHIICNLWVSCPTKTLSINHTQAYYHRRSEFGGNANFTKVIVESDHWQLNWSTTHWGMEMWVSGLVEGQPCWPLWTVISSLHVFIVHCSTDTLLSCKCTGFFNTHINRTQENSVLLWWCELLQKITLYFDIIVGDLVVILT